MLLQECHGVCCRRGRRRTKLLEEQSEGGERNRVSCILGNLRAFCMPLQRGVAISTEHSTKNHRHRRCPSNIPRQHRITPHHCRCQKPCGSNVAQGCCWKHRNNTMLSYSRCCVFFGSAKGQPTGDFNRKTLVILVWNRFFSSATDLQSTFVHVPTRSTPPGKGWQR